MREAKKLMMLALIITVAVSATIGMSACDKDKDDEPSKLIGTTWSVSGVAPREFKDGVYNGQDLPYSEKIQFTQAEVLQKVQESKLPEKVKGIFSVLLNIELKFKKDHSVIAVFKAKLGDKPMTMEVPGNYEDKGDIVVIKEFDQETISNYAAMATAANAPEVGKMITSLKNVEEWFQSRDSNKGMPFVRVNEYIASPRLDFGTILGTANWEALTNAEKKAKPNGPYLLHRRYCLYFTQH